MIDMDRYAYRSSLRNHDAVQKIFFASFMMAICFWAKLIIISAIIFLLMSGFTIVKGRIPIAVYIKTLLIPFSFFLVGAITLFIDKAGHSEIFVFAIPFGSEYIGIVKGAWLLVIRLLAQAVSLVSCLYFLAFNTPIVDLLAGLRRLKIPQLIIELLGLIYRFIFIILTEVNVIFVAQQSRLGYSSYRTSFRSLGSLIATVFVRSYRRFDHLYTALESRGYSGEIVVLNEPKLPGRTVFWSSLFWGIILIILTLWLRHRY